MNSYFIFALVLTVAYVIYYAAVITHDLYGKRERIKRTRRFSTSVHRRTRKKASLLRRVKRASVSAARATTQKAQLPFRKYRRKKVQTTRLRRRKNWSG